MEQNPKQQILEKETIEKTTARTKIRILIETLKKKIHQKKLSSHKNLKKSTRRSIIALCVLFINVLFTFLQLLDLQKKEDKNSNKTSRENI